MNYLKTTIKKNAALVTLLAVTQLSACNSENNNNLNGNSDLSSQISASETPLLSELKVNDSLNLTPKMLAQEASFSHEKRNIDFNFGWKFKLTPVGEKPEVSAFEQEFNDDNWQDIRLPHDWSIQQEYTQEHTAGATGYLPGGFGWYRKAFQTPKGDKVQILFDGVYNHSKVWINGYLLGERPYGYSPFYYDLTPYLHNDGSENTIAVYVDRSRYIDSRWYTGSGIYRNVKLVVTDNSHIPVWGNYVTTPKISADSATVHLTTQVKNNGDEPHSYHLVSRVYSPKGELVASHRKKVNSKAQSENEVTQGFELPDPLLWDLDSPHLYSAHTSLFVGDNLVDKTITKFGIRSLKNDPKKGFSLNGRNIKIKGVNLHHDAGLVGAAVPKGVWKRRLAILKKAGVNAIRTAHNPVSQEFLDLCDEMGFMVQNEIFDEWDNPKDKRKNFNSEGPIDYVTQSYSLDFAKWAERDLKAAVMRDRNHPSIIQWSIGNEIEWTYPRYGIATGYWNGEGSDKVNYYWDAPPYTPEKSKEIFDGLPEKGAVLAETAAKLSKWVKELDTTRPVTANLVTPSVGHFSGYTDTLDIVGYSYRQSVYEYGHKHYPEKMIMGTENWVQWHEWQAILDKDYIPGIFVWTGFDYLGESNGLWPKKGTQSGMVDFAGFTKPSFHMMKTLWSDEPHVYITTQNAKDSTYTITATGDVIEKNPGNWRKGKWGWQNVNPHWNYQVGETVFVEAYSNSEYVELLLNGKSLGVKSVFENPDRIAKWAVPFEQGQLTIRAVTKQESDYKALLNKGSEEVTSTIFTAGSPASIRLTLDKTELNGDGYDVSHIVAQLLDENGNEVMHTDKTITFELTGDIRSLGVDNGAANNIQPHNSLSIKTANGRALIIVQSLAETSSALASISASASKLKGDKKEITIN